MGRRIRGAFNRVEGDLEVTLEISGGRVERAWVVSPLYRGFEQMLQGKEPEDALVYVPRICGICSVAQSVAAAQALAQLEGVVPTGNGRLATNLILACEYLADHLTHFYLFFMPDFTRERYARRPWHAAVARRFTAVRGESARELLPARAAFLHITGLLAGKWPHTLSIRPGGTTVAPESQQIVRLMMILHEFRRFLEDTLFGDTLENLAGLGSVAELEAWQENKQGVQSDFRQFLDLARELDLAAQGRGPCHFLSYGVYDLDQGRLFAPGTWFDGGLHPLDQECIREDLSHAWMHGDEEPLHPNMGITRPDRPREDGPAYTWCKAPRLAGRPMEVGALARQQVNGHPLIRDLVAHGGSNVMSRVVARLLEIALVVMAMERWIGQLVVGEPYCAQGAVPDEGVGRGMMEAARGSLGHWLDVRQGRIHNYQIIAPTTWNFSPRDAIGQPGVLEQALVGTPVQEGEREPVAVQHIVRSFDPCMVCTVH